MPQQGGINAPYTRLRGPVLVGQSSDFGVAAVNGGSTAPLVSFWNASEFGYYVSASGNVRFTAPGGDLIVYTSASVQLNAGAGGGAMVSFTSARLASASTAGATDPPSFVWASTAFLSTSAVSGYLYVPQTTYAMSSSSGTSSGPTPTAINTGAALVFDSARSKLSVFSTVANQWLSITLSSS